jgi:fumarate hydratase class II
MTGIENSSQPSTRIERDSMGAVTVPRHARWGASTQRALDNIPLGVRNLPPSLIHSLGLVKACAARANVTAGALSPVVGEAIAIAADEVAAGKHDDQFPVGVFQTGSGTSSNMNANEVIAALAASRSGDAVHANDHVNASQSSNDVFPTAAHVAVALTITSELLPAMHHLQDELTTKSQEFHGVVKTGRTHLMDAAPVTLGAEYAGYARQLELGQERLLSSLPRLLELPIGGTAVGTGLNAPPTYAQDVVDRLSAATGLAFVRAENPFEAQSARDAVVEISSQLRVVALSLWKVCGDLRWSGSGPYAGLGEVELPALQPGSSIMPGKVNPVVPEAIMQACARVVGNDAAVTLGATTSRFELNTAMPLLADAVLESVDLLAASCRLLADRVVSALRADVGHLRQLAERSPAVATALNTLVGYEAATEIVRQAVREGSTIREVAQRLVHDGTLTQQQLDHALDIDRLAKGG